jgi:octaprenyl-diphosphate synthase
MNISAADAASLSAFLCAAAAETEKAMRLDLAAALAGCDPLLAEVLHHTLLAGGKRLRPALVMISAQLCGRDDAKLRLLAAAFEYLHAATLIHDDVIDHADTRRGRVSVVKQHGLAAAILAGDWLHARSMNLIGVLTGKKGLDMFCKATTEMVDGEFLQMRCAADPSATEEQYAAVIRKKTAGLISAACAVGAAYAKGAEEQIAALALYGEKIGIAFQIADDLLDYLGDAQATGKKTGNDFAEGKMTLPLIHALRCAEEQDRNELLRIFQGDRSQSPACAAARQIMEQAGSFTYVRHKAEREVAEATAALVCFDQDRQREGVAVLRSLAGYILSRDS